jgi:hypothetical protein
MESGLIKNDSLNSCNYGDTETELKTKIHPIFDKQNQMVGVFSDELKLNLPRRTFRYVCRRSDVKLFNSNLDVGGRCFRISDRKKFKGEKGQYFTTPYVIDML